MMKLDLKSYPDIPHPANSIPVSGTVVPSNELQRSTVAEMGINWVCEQCTYQNPAHRANCEMCLSDRPAGYMAEVDEVATTALGGVESDEEVCDRN